MYRWLFSVVVLRNHSCVGELSTVDKEAFAIVSTFRRLEHLLWNGVHIFTDHRNLAYIFNPGACVTSVSKALAQRLEGWKGVLGQYRYTICHISGDRNAWGDFCRAG